VPSQQQPRALRRAALQLRPTATTSPRQVAVQRLAAVQTDAVRTDALIHV